MEKRWPKSLDSILSLKGQVSKLYLALNGFTRVPPELAKEEWVVPWHVGRNLGDIAKFADAECDIYLSCDDDLVYPSTYCQDFIDESAKHPNCVLTHHGNTAEGPTRSYFKMRYNSTRVQCLMKNAAEIKLTIPGTGVTYFPGEVYRRFYEELVEGFNHADLIAGKVLKEMEVEIWAVPHPKHYFQYLKPPDGSTIWEQNVKWDKKMTKIWNTLNL